jgi:hypothetical protein
MEMARSLFPDMRLMSAGAFVTSRHTFSIDDVITTIEQNMKLYRTLRRPQVFDQPVLNFVLHRLAKRCRHISELDPSIVGLSSSGNPNLEAMNGNIFDRSVAGEVLAIHWAGNMKSWLQLRNPRTRSIQMVRESIRNQAIQRVNSSESAAIASA